MSNNNYNPNTIKSFVVESRAPAEQVPLDYFYISRTNEEKSSIPVLKNKRFPDDDRWHSLAFRTFADECLNSRFNYMGVDWLGDITINNGVFKPRWSRDYMRRSLARIYKFAEACSVVEESQIDDFLHVGLNSAHFVTLSVHHAVTGSYRSMRKTVEDLRSAWSGVARWVNRKGWHYLRVMEPGEINHYPHFHMVIVGATDSEVQEFIHKWLESCDRRNIKASCKAQYSERVENIHNVGAYITKYMSKSFGEDEDSDNNEWWWRWMELCYREHIRVYAMDGLTSKYILKTYKNVRDSGIGFTDFVFPDSKIDDYDDVEIPAEHPPEKAECVEYAFTRADESPTCLGLQSAPIIIRGSGGFSPPRMKAGDDII